MDRVNQILIVDDHPIFCLGVKEMINREADLNVVAWVETAREAREFLAENRPDLVIVDLALKESNGMELVAQIREMDPDLPTLVLSMYDEVIYGERALKAGARGYVMKQGLVGQVVGAIRTVLSGGVHLGQAVRENLLRRMVAGSQPGEDFALDVLTNRELEVFRLMGEGMSAGEIAAMMHLSPKTVGTHREKIKSKLGIKHYTELMKTAVHWVHRMRC